MTTGKTPIEIAEFTLNLMRDYIRLDEEGKPRPIPFVIEQVESALAALRAHKEVDVEALKIETKNALSVIWKDELSRELKPFEMVAIDLSIDHIIAKGYLQTPPPAKSGGWLPIETAPRDGTNFLVLKNGHVCQAKYAPKFSADHYGESDPGIYLYGYDCRGDDATHWQPLPAPPGQTHTPAQCNKDPKSCHRVRCHVPGTCCEKPAQGYRQRALESMPNRYREDNGALIDTIKQVAWFRKYYDTIRAALGWKDE